MAFVQSVVGADAPGTGPTGTATITATAGNTLVVKIAQTIGSVCTYTVASSINGALTHLVSINPAVAVGAHIFWLPIASGGTHTLTVTASQNMFFEFCIEEWSGIDTSVAPITASNTGASGLSHFCAPSGSIDVTQGCAITCVGSADNLQTTQVVGAGYTSVLPFTAAATNQVMFQYRSVASGVTTDDRGAWTATGTARVAHGCMVALTYLVTTVTRSIGTAGRNYSTITLWEADLDNTGVYAANNDAVGECYNDSNFNESFTINGGNTVGLNNKTLRPATGQGHTGLAGTGVRIVSSPARSWILGGTAVRVEGIEFNLNGLSVATQAQLAIGSGPTAVLPALIHRVIVHDGAATVASANARYLAQIDTGLGTIQNSLFYNWTVTNSSTGTTTGLFTGNSSAFQRLVNCTVHNVIRNTGSGLVRCVNTAANNICRNVIATGAGGTTTGTIAAFVLSATGTGKTHNLSDDAGDVDSSTSVTFAVVADLYVSTVGGSEDLRLKVGAAAVNVGVDLGTALDGQFDITGLDRTSTGTTWDIGAHELVAGPATHYVLDALVASLVLTGPTVTLERTYLLDALSTALVITGATVNLDYAAAATLPNPMAYWPFNEGSGTAAADATGNGHDATLVFSTWNSALAKFGGFAAETNQHATSNVGFHVNSPFSIGTVHSISWWMDGHPAANSGNIFNNEPIGPPYSLCYFDGFSAFFYNAGGSTAYVNFSGGNAGSHHWVLTRNNTAFAFYRDGVEQATATLGSNNPFFVYDLFLALVGVIDDLRIYDVALTAQQVAALYALTPLVHSSLDALPATLTLSGKSVGLDIGRVIDVLPAALSLSGKTVSLDYVPLIPAYAIDVLPTALTLAGASVSLEVRRLLDVLPAALTLTGWPVSLDIGVAVQYSLDALPNGLTITPTAVGLDRTYMLWVEPEALVLEGLEIGLVFRRSEVGWDTSLHPPVDACRKPLSAQLHPTQEAQAFEGELLHPEIKGARQPLSDATHPKANVALPIPLPRKDC